MIGALEPPGDRVALVEAGRDECAVPHPLGNLQGDRKEPVVTGSLRPGCPSPDQAGISLQGTLQVLVPDLEPLPHSLGSLDGYEREPGRTSLKVRPRT